MHSSEIDSPLVLRRFRLLVVIGGMLLMAPFVVRAQLEPQAGDAPAPAAAGTAPATPAAAAEPSVWDLAVQGGVFMIPILICSIVVVAFTLERSFALRGRRILPAGMLAELERLNSEEKGLDPRAAYKLCQKYHSPFSSVVRAAILKIGRPHAEVEKAVEDAVAREAAALARNIRPINVCASISPLLGLLGTVQGMILAFMVTSTTTASGSGKAQELAQGIYTALVTTFAGLCVAVLAVLFASYLEGRLDRLLRDMEEIFLEILPQFERYEGKLRITRTVPRSKTAAATADVRAASAPASESSDPDADDASPSEAAGGPGWKATVEGNISAKRPSQAPAEGQSGVIVTGRKPKS